MAAAIVTSPKHSVHRENGRLEVMMIDEVSYRVDMSWKKRLEASASIGMYPTELSH